jgi:hypothetical protein
MPVNIKANQRMAVSKGALYGGSVLVYPLSFQWMQEGTENN